MSFTIELPTFNDDRGTLSVCQGLLPFTIQRFYFVYDVTQCRGGHRHKESVQALIALGGSCDIYINDGVSETTVVLNSPRVCLVLEPKDWHTMDAFTKGTTLMVLSSTVYNRADYIDEPYT